MRPMRPGVWGAPFLTSRSLPLTLSSTGMPSLKGHAHDVDTFFEGQLNVISIFCLCAGYSLKCVLQYFSVSFCIASMSFNIVNAC
jgi:hypothetical protein